MASLGGEGAILSIAIALCGVSEGGAFALCERACLVNMLSAGDDEAILRLERYSYTHPGSVWVARRLALSGRRVRMPHDVSLIILSSIR